jgi:phosphatidylglycerol:prolipoprotein diacylglycerol transferase
VHPFFQLTESVSIPAYGVFLVLAMLSAIALGCHLATRVGVPFWKMVDLAFQFCIAGEIGARLLFLVVEWRALVDGEIPLRQLLVAGRVVFGAILGGALFSLWLFRKHRLPVLASFDFALAVVPLGMGIGRIGCLMGGCCYGKPTSSILSITFRDPTASRISGTPLGIPLVPIQIYQAVEGILLCAILVWIFTRRRFDGQVSALFLLIAGASRFAWEFLRDDRRGSWIGLATSQWIGLAMIAGGVILWAWASRRNRLERYEPEPASLLTKNPRQVLR